MKISVLAQRLGISRQMTHRLKARGMPCNSLESAIEWRRQNLDITQTKRWRIDGNSGVKRQPVQVNKSMVDNDVDESILNEFDSDAERKIVSKVLTNVIPSLWFGQIGWLGGALRDHGVKITTEQLIKVQALLFYVYMSEVDEFLKTENQFKLPDALMAKPGDKNYSYLIESLNKTLSQEPMQLYES